MKRKHFRNFIIWPKVIFSKSYKVGHPRVSHQKINIFAIAILLTHIVSPFQPWFRFLKKIRLEQSALDLKAEAIEIQKFSRGVSTENTPRNLILPVER